MRLFRHLDFEEGSDDWFFEPVIARFFGSEIPFAMTEHSTRDGEWELEELVRSFPEAAVLRRSDAMDDKNGTPSINRLLLKVEGVCFILWDAPRMYVLATESGRSRDLMGELAKNFFKPKRHRNKAVFNVIFQQYGETASTSVPVKRPFLRKAEDFAIHYGEPFLVFHESLVSRMKRLRQGVAVLRGEPGTGKTTYIRALMWQLRRTHRFYTIPLQEFTRMTASDVTSFWLDEKKKHEKQTIVMVIEDAEDLIRGDGHERPPQIATLLNLSDGLIGELLEFQIIVTVNCPLEDIDPAITRKGRLMAYHEFRRLTEAEAARLAAHHNLKLYEPSPAEGWTLAEVFNFSEAGGYERGVPARLGF